MSDPALASPIEVSAAITLDQVSAGSAQEPGSANNDINPLQGKVVPIAVPNWTDTNDWYLMADPAQIEGIELGFLNGRQEPEILVQDNQTAGTVFTRIVMSSQTDQFSR